MKIVVSGGGTGGHIYPATSIAKMLKEERNAETYYIGSLNGLEQDIVNQNEFTKTLFLNTIGLHRRNPLIALKSIWLQKKATKQVVKFFKTINPDYVFVTGGFATVPVTMAAKKLNLKLIVHEQNSEPGLASKLASKNAYKVFISFPESAKFFDENKVVYTGNPRTDEVHNINAKIKDQIVIFSGSRGALKLNENIVKLYPQLNELGSTIIHITGKNYFNEVDQNLSNINVVEYDNDLINTMAASKLVIARAGATTISELLGLDKPSILIPSPYVTNKHQHKNAEILVNAGGAILVEEENMLEELIDNIKTMDDEKINEFTNKIEDIVIPHFKDELLKVIK